MFADSAVSAWGEHGTGGGVGGRREDDCSNLYALKPEISFHFFSTQVPCNAPVGSYVQQGLNGRGRNGRGTGDYSLA